MQAAHSFYVQAGGGYAPIFSYSNSLPSILKPLLVKLALTGNFRTGGPAAYEAPLRFCISTPPGRRGADDPS